MMLLFILLEIFCLTLVQSDKTKANGTLEGSGNLSPTFPNIFNSKTSNKSTTFENVEPVKPSTTDKFSHTSTSVWNKNINGKFILTLTFLKIKVFTEIVNTFTRINNLLKL